MIRGIFFPGISFARMRTMKTVIWDYNGTILDDLDICLQIENEMLKERNMPAWPVDRETYLDHFGFPVIDYYYYIGYTFETETYDDISVEFNERYDELFAGARLMPEFLPAIRRSVASGNRNVILSACKHDKLIRQCRELGIEQYFDEILGIDNLLAGSKTEMALAWLERSKTDPDTCLYLGDSLHDLDTARALGVKDCILIASGHQSMKVLKGGYERVVSSLDEVEL